MPTWDREQFQELIKDALAHLYDFAYLRTLPLLDALVPDGGESSMDRVLRLRQRLQLAIERLAPVEQIPETAKEWRPYLALRYHYVDCLDLQQVEKRLGLGDRQLLRERNRGLEALAALLYEETLTASEQDPQRAPLAGEDSLAAVSTVTSEISAMGVEYTQTSICDTVDRARQAVAGLSAQHAVEIDCSPIDDQLVVLADAALLRQTLIAALSHAIAACTAGPISVEAGLLNRCVSITVTWREAPVEQTASLAALAALVSAQKGSVQVDRLGETTVLTLSIPQGRIASILVIEDNPSLLQLYGRYLATEQYRVLRTETGAEGLAMARSELPDVIVLDVMMRGMDGWEVLQRLRAQSETQSIPVIICSVLPERDLALSLGADAFLTKPVARFDLLDTIQACLRRPRSAAPRHPAGP